MQVGNAWVQCGSSPATQYTMDTYVNDNLDSMGPARLLQLILP
jgi:hypothetical protein